MLQVKIKFIIAVIVLIPCLSYAQNSHSRKDTIRYPDIGKPCPDVVFEKIHYYKKDRATIEDFKGKWLVLDFFTTGCAACFESFPRMNKLINGLEDQVQLLLVALEDGRVQDSYERFRQKLKLNMPITYMKRANWNKFGIYGVPHIMVMDKRGTIRAITGKITREELEKLLSGSDPELGKKPNPAEMKQMLNAYDINKPLLINGNGGADTAFLFRSVLAGWDGKAMGTNQPYVSAQDFGNRVQVIAEPLASLYYLAYGDTVSKYPMSEKYLDRPSCYGRFWYTPLLEVSDSSAFINDYRSTKNAYSYSLIVPRHRASSKFLQQVMRRDLNSYFGYKVTVETRMMPYWRLVATQEARIRLKTKGGKWSSKDEIAPRTGIVMINHPIEALIRQLFLIFPNEPPFINETGIEGNIDIRVDGLTTDFADFRKGLQENGLDLVMGKKEMKVIVIRD